MREVLERLVATAKAAMLENIEENQEWERHTRMNASSLLSLLTEALSAAAEELFPGGIPANNQMNGRHWNSKNREIIRLISKRGVLIRMLAHEKGMRATAVRLDKLEAKVNRKQRQIRENLRQNRDAYWTEVARKLEEAYEDKDMKMYYKLIKEAHGPQMPSTTKGAQSLTGQHMKMKQGTERTTTKVELEARWVEHFRELFNQPGILGNGVDLCLPAQRELNVKIRTDPFDLAELTRTIKDMNNDKAAGLDGYCIEMEKYVAGEQYLELELAM